MADTIELSMENCNQTIIALKKVTKTAELKNEKKCNFLKWK